MLALSKKTDYALISLAYLAERQGRWVSAREIAEVSHLPLPLLMQILKILHNQGLLRSTRGVKGGYRLGADLDRVSLHALIELLHAEDEVDRPVLVQRETAAPVEALRQKLSQFLREVRLSEVVSPGKRIDVPLSRLRIAERVPLHRLESAAGGVCATCCTFKVNSEPAERSDPVAAP